MREYTIQVEKEAISGFEHDLRLLSHKYNIKVIEVVGRDSIDMIRAKARRSPARMTDGHPTMEDYNRVTKEGIDNLLNGIIESDIGDESFADKMLRQMPQSTYDAFSKALAKGCVIVGTPKEPIFRAVTPEQMDGLLEVTNNDGHIFNPSDIDFETISTITLLEKQDCEEFERPEKEFRPAYDKLSNVQKKNRKQTNRKKKRRKK